MFGFLAFYTRPSIDIRGVYTDKNEVALYIMEYRQLPKNYITKADRESAYAVDIKDKVIGGDTYWGKDGITVKVGEETEILHLKNLKECDVKTNSYDIYESRGKERLVYTTNTEEVRIFYTVDHYDTFTEITPEGIYKTSTTCTNLFFITAGVTVVVFFFTRKKEPAPKKDGDSQA